MTATVAQFIGILDRLASPLLAETWDNVGLQLGSRNWPVNKIWTALDPLPEVVARACEKDVDLLVTHHPLFFKPVKCINCDTPQGRIAQMALSHRLAIYSAHTNLDSASNGVNDALAQRIGLRCLRVLDEPKQIPGCKLVFFVPSEQAPVVLDTLFSLDAGRFESYSRCTFRSEGVRTYPADSGTSLMPGGADDLVDVQESRVEVLLARTDLDIVVETVKKALPQETMTYDIYPLTTNDQRMGLGRVGQLPASMPLDAFAVKLKDVLNVATVKLVGKPDMTVETVAVCSGSGASMLKAALASGAQVYVSGDLGYHTARDAEQAGIGLVDIGHFGSERLVVDVLAAAIRKASETLGLAVSVECANMETDPFYHL
jgi:dinuclear metal center YbgI/SA1388 family protein